MDKENIKKALDDFENDKFTDAKDALQKEIRNTKDAFLKDKLGLKGDVGDTSSPESDEKGE